MGDIQERQEPMILLLGYIDLSGEGKAAHSVY